MAGATAEGEQNPWPAFVDVLTTVIMVVTFLLVIMSAGIMQLSTNLVAKAEQASGVDALREAEKEVARLRAALAEAEEKSNLKISLAERAVGATLVRGDATTPGTVAVATTSRKSDTQSSFRVDATTQQNDSGGEVIRSANAILTLKFDPDAVRVDQSIMRSSVETIRRANFDASTKFEVWSTTGISTTISDAQRRAYFRAVAVRNILIEAGIRPSNIVAQVRVAQNPIDAPVVHVMLKP